ncbi:MAG: CDP-diacylglycerol--serine O-phosphatidyltransferase [Rhodobacteraceae bacterium]|nr:CDP-diacylglycerol--serine O-phosphatidyltransferase [Paracoccaceae bacterium]
MEKPGRDVALIQLLPNAMTLGAICAGVTAMRMALTGQFDHAVAFLIVAALLDGLDGRLARILGSESLLGAELDSLADVVNFGVAPAIVLYLWALGQAPVLGWAAALAYIICCALRLARFNVSAKTDMPVDRRFFTGVPAPAGAMLALAPLLLSRAVPELGQLPVWLSALWLVLIAGLMISRLPTFSLKLKMPGTLARAALLLVAGAIITLAAYPWETLLAVDIFYLASLPLAWKLRRSLPAV